MEQVGFELATPRSVLFEKLSANLAWNSDQDKSSAAAENLIAGISPGISEPIPASSARLDTAGFLRYFTLISARQDWLQRRTGAMCVAVREGGRTAHETQNLGN